jgi:hypothetical protein
LRLSSDWSPVSEVMNYTRGASFFSTGLLARTV